MSNDLSLMEIVGYQVESSAEWRREKAEQFPRDSHRNLRAAEGLEQLAKEIGELEGSDINLRVRETIDRMDADDCYELNEWVSAEIRSIGFSNSHSGRGFVEWYCGRIEEMIQRRTERELEELDDAVETPDLASQVENDPAVKAAKQAYDEARAKAYAEARKRL
jgi:hypothetical protein